MRPLFPSLLFDNKLNTTERGAADVMFKRGTKLISKWKWFLSKCSDSDHLRLPSWNKSRRQIFHIYHMFGKLLVFYMLWPEIMAKNLSGGHPSYDWKYYKRPLKIIETVIKLQLNQIKLILNKTDLILRSLTKTFSLYK